MKSWNKPEILSLNIQLTNGGNKGGAGDGVEYNIPGYGKFIGTSGPTDQNPAAQ